ncbi:MAG: O-antigen ligase family protein [Eubacterium sp.]|nr:O-antigen ligase family protein [Eubacterium sp.]
MNKKQLIHLKELYMKYVYPVSAMYATIFFVVFYLCNYMNYGLDWWMTGTKTLRQIAFYCCILTVVGILVSKKCLEMKLLLGYFCWIVISRVALGDLILHQVRNGNWMAVSSCWGLMLCAFLGSSIYFTQKQRRLFVSILTIILVGMLSVWAVIAIPTAIGGKPLVGQHNIFLGAEYTTPPLVYISFFRMHRNISATFFVCTLGLSFYQSVMTKKLFWKIITAIFLPLSFIAVALQHSRSNYLTYAVVVSLVAMLLVGGRIRIESTLIKAVVCLVLTGACVVAVYAGFHLCNEGVLRLSTEVQSNVETPAGEEPNLPQGQNASAQLTRISDSRDTLKDSATLNHRSGVWKAALKTLKENPKILFLGQPEETMMDLVNEKIDSPVNHMHNLFFQQLMFVGLPGLILILGFLGALGKRVVDCFRNQRKKEMFVLPVTLAGLMVYGVFEPLLFPMNALASTMFMIQAGLLIADCKSVETAQEN